MSRPRIVLCSRELFPFGGGGIGAYVAESARMLAPVVDVTILTASWHRDPYRELAAGGDPRVDYGGAAIAFVEVPEPHEYGDFYSHMHVYSHRVLARLRELFGARGPDLVEFSDYLGEGFITTQARRSHDAFLEHTRIAVRVHTSDEIKQVLDGRLESDFEARISRALERRALRDADALIYSGGDILGTYERFYGGRLPPAARIPYPMRWPDPLPAGASGGAGPLRMLHIGRLERRKGVYDLVEALTGLDAEWELTLIGADTPTAPAGGSMRRALELRADGDRRITFAPAVPRAELPERMRHHDVVVLPSRWECWPYVALEALAAGMPLAGTPVGGLCEMIKPEVTGWLAAGTGPEALREMLGPLVADPQLARRRRDPQRVRHHLHALADPDAFRAAYLELASQPRRPRAPGGDRIPLVSVVIPYFRMHRFVEEAVRSVFAQTHARIETIVVDDGSFEPADIVLADLARRYPLRVVSQANRGLGGARNYGMTLSRGRYALPLDADNVLEPTFVERCVSVLEQRADLCYVTAWSRYMTEDGTPFPPHAGYRPVGNWTALVEERNVAGDGTAVLRRSVFDRHRYSEDLTAYEDWALYRELHRSGRHGHVIPEVLWRYRIRDDSMLREVGLRHDERLMGEIEAVIREKEIEWASSNG